MEHKQCEFSLSCRENADYALYRTNDEGQKLWIQVCDKHEREVARENLRRCGGEVRMLQKTGNIRDESGLIVGVAKDGTNRNRHQAPS